MKHEEWVAPCGAVFAEYGEMVQHGLSHTEHRQCLEWARWSMEAGSGLAPVGVRPRHMMTDADKARARAVKRGA